MAVDIKLDVALDAAVALLGTTTEALKGAGRSDDEGQAFRRAVVTLLLVETGFDRDRIREVLGFASLSAVHNAASLVRERLEGSSAFRIEFRRMLRQIQTASPATLRFTQLRNAMRSEGQNQDTLSIVAAALTLAETIQANHATFAPLALTPASEIEMDGVGVVKSLGEVAR